MKKNKGIWFGCEHPPVTKYLPELNFEWNPETFRIPGIDFTTDLKDITDINLRKKLPEIKKQIDQWSKRQLTPFGKITIIKSLLLSQIVHILTSLPNPSENTLKHVQNMFYNFLWDGKPDKIKRSTGKQKLTQGGLGMIDIQAINTSLKTT